MDASYRPPENSRLVGSETIEVFETDPPSRPTGILDANGKPIVWRPKRRPIGFIHFGDAE